MGAPGIQAVPDYLRREAIAEPGSTEAAQIVEILRQSEAYSRMTEKFLASPHPFEPNPDVISESPEAARARGQRELEVLRNNVARVLDNASRQGVPETTIEAIRSYYSGQITAHERSVAWLEPDQIQLRTLAGAIAALEKSPSPNVRILEAYRAQKAELEKRMTHAE